MKRNAISKLLACLLLSVACQAQAGLNEGVVAYGRGEYTQALQEFRAAADAGDIYAQFNLGVMYALGQGVKQDQTTAIGWYRKAADKGLPWAQFNLGQAYEEAYGVERDEVAAVNWYRKAAEQDFPRAQFNLGLMYARGQGVKPDVVQAYKWFHLAELNREPYAERNRANAEKKMTPAQIEAAMNLAREWQPRKK